MNAYIAILEFASRQDTLTFSSLYQYINENNITQDGNIKITESNTMLLKIFRTSFENLEGEKPGKNVYEGTYSLTLDARAYLLNYQSFELAWVNAEKASAYSLRAYKQSTWALIIAIITLLTSLLLPVFLN